MGIRQGNDTKAVMDILQESESPNNSGDLLAVSKAAEPPSAPLLPQESESLLMFNCAMRRLTLCTTSSTANFPIIVVASGVMQRGL